VTHQDQYLEPIIPFVGEDTIICAANYRQPDCLWPESHPHHRQGRQRLV
jgi:hypothetical protein